MSSITKFDEAQLDLSQKNGPIIIIVIILVLCSPILCIWLGEKNMMASTYHPIEELPAELQAAFAPDPEFFQPVPSPRPGDWLAQHREPGQTFEQFVNTKPMRPDNIRKTIYLQPLEHFVPAQSPELPFLQEYVQAYFGMQVQLLPVLMQGKKKFTSRLNPYTGHPQILTTDVLRVLKKSLPDDAFCVLAITMQDLYPAPSWNFVFGQASPQYRVGVFSFFRYDPAVYGLPRDEQYQTLLLKRSCKVLSHEAGHLFGLAHCIFYACLMNGSNHLEESDTRPMHLCPVCLRKLHYSIGFDVINRYRNLQNFYQKAGFKEETRWAQKRLKRISGEKE